MKMLVMYLKYFLLVIGDFLFDSLPFGDQIISEGC